MVFSLRNTWSRANYSLIFSTLYLHHDHKYLSDKRLPSFFLKPREKTQLKAKFWLIDNLLPSDMASGKVNFEVELMAVVVVKLTLGYNRGYLVRFVCSNLKLANASSEVGGNWTMLGVTKTCTVVSGPWPQWAYY
ncbi:hypothetical protein SO802_025089 [Lithocarpus litseifolius]|uniref:Uncharacterized protein n=1 Tax=Lithocarpus litseifolius TaxID=425828 RepID=A0AAW2BZ20_9ROSI